MEMINKLLCFMFSIVFSRWLVNDRKVVKVKGWRTAIVQGRNEMQQTITPCFKILWVKFE